MICVLAGGVGAARLLNGLKDVAPPEEITAIVNTGDDAIMHGLYICPDIDTVTYTLAGVNNIETGWGLKGETWLAMESLKKLGGKTWFNLGDRDLATHMYRTDRLSEGAGLKEITAEITSAMGVSVNLLPMTEDRIETKVTLLESNDEISFQEYFVKNKCIPAVRSLRFEGAESCTSSPALDHALDKCDILVICPSNPFLSVRPILAIPGVKEKIQDFNGVRVVVSPIVNGKAIKGPAGKMLEELGYNSSAVGVAQQYKGLCDIFVIDRQDIDLASQIESVGLQVLVADTVMANKFDKIKLAEDILGMCGL